MKPNSIVYRQYIANLPPLTPELKEILIGLLLGDVAIQTQNKGKTFRLKFEWSDKYKAYAFHVYNLFKPYILKEPQLRIRINKNGNEVHTWWFNTVSTEIFLPIAQLFLNDKFKKIITKDLILNHCGARSLAYWFMDDGGKLSYGKNQGKGIVLNTHSFTEQEVDNMIFNLKTKFHFNCWKKLNKGKYIIVISGHSYDKFFNLCSPFIISEMKHKLPSLLS
jgi:hypothetical protein